MSFRLIVLAGAAGIALASGAEAADLPSRHAAPTVDYVRVCTAYGAGYFTIPGTNTCLKIGGAVRASTTVRPAAPSNAINQASTNIAQAPYPRSAYYDHARAYLNLDVRSETDYGPLTATISERMTYDSLPATPYGGGKAYLNGAAGVYTSYGTFQGTPSAQNWFDAAYVQWAGITAGVKHSYFDFYTHSYEIQAVSLGVSDQPLPLIAYTLALGSGLSASISAEDSTFRDLGDGQEDIGLNQNNPKNATTDAFLAYGGERAPDIVGNLHAEGPWGSAQIAGALHEVNSAPIYGCSSATALVLPEVANCATGTGRKYYLPLGYTPSPVWGFAVMGGAKINLDALNKGDSATVQVSYDQGATDYLNSEATGYAGMTSVYDKDQSIAVPGNDAFVTPTGQIVLSRAAGLFAGYQHYWTPSVHSDLFGSYMEITNPDYAENLSSSAASAHIWDLGANVFWNPIRNLEFGVEVVYTNLALSAPASTLVTYTPNGTSKTEVVPADSSDVRGRFRIQYRF
ncbi:MAG: porin [Hyphomicrobiales bacterium]|nr:porin [Hyphomicrobiales bacterium]